MEERLKYQKNYNQYMNQKIKEVDKIFESINKDLSKKYKGKMVAIDTDSGNYFLGDSALDAYNKAIKKYPRKQFVFKRIGFNVPYFAGAI